MFAILGVLIALILVAYLLRLGYGAVVKRQRIDWRQERRRFQQELGRMREFMKRLVRYYWRG